MADFTFLVRPEELERTSSEFSKLVDSIERHFQRINEISGKTRGYWVGDAGDRGREGYTSYQDDISFITKRLGEHPVDLLKMAGIYKKAEQRAETISTKLRVDQIV